MSETASIGCFPWGNTSDAFLVVARCKVNRFKDQLLVASIVLAPTAVHQTPSQPHNHHQIHNPQSAIQRAIAHSSHEMSCHRCPIRCPISSQRSKAPTTFSDPPTHNPIDDGPSPLHEASAFPSSSQSRTAPTYNPRKPGEAGIYLARIARESLLGEPAWELSRVCVRILLLVRRVCSSCYHYEESAF